MYDRENSASRSRSPVYRSSRDGRHTSDRPRSSSGASGSGSRPSRDTHTSEDVIQRAVSRALSAFSSSVSVSFVEKKKKKNFYFCISLA